MTVTCPTPPELHRLFDQELPERQAQALREHAATCGRCREAVNEHQQLVGRIAAPIPGLDVEQSVAQVMARLDEPPRVATVLPFWRRPRAVLMAAVPLAAAATLLAVLSLHSAAPPRAEYAARGGPPAEPFAKVGVTVHALGPPQQRLADGARFSGASGLMTSFTNLDEGVSPYLLLFAVDARGQVHWLQPGHTDPTRDPEAIRLPYAREPTALPETVALESPAPGEMRILSIVSRQPLKVSEVDPLPPSKLSEEALRARWPDAHVAATQVFVTE